MEYKGYMKNRVEQFLKRPYLAITILLVMACQEIAEIVSTLHEPTLIIDALMTNIDEPNLVKISTSTPFSDSLRFNPVNNSIVTIANDKGENEQLVNIASGIFQSSMIKGVVGGKYIVEVLYEGQIYSAESELLPIADIDSLTYGYFEKRQSQEEGYYVSLFAGKSSENEISYYQWKVYKNDALLNGPSDLKIANDEFSSSLNALQFQYPFEKGDTVKIEMYSLTKEAYNYYYQLFNLINAFDPDPVNPVSNFTGNALGIFQASAVTSKTIVIE